MNSLKSPLFALARSRYAAYFMGIAFEFFTSMMPVRRLYEDRHVIAFPHPAPFWKIHSLIVPKRAISTFASVDLSEQASVDRLLQVLQTAQGLARKQRLKEYTILVNGGAYQDVPQLHFHLASGARKDDKAVLAEKNVANLGLTPSITLGNAAIAPHPTPVRQFHHLLWALDETPNMVWLDFFNADQRSTLADLLRLAQLIVVNEQLDRYTLLANVTAQEFADEGRVTNLQFHLVSGDTV